MVDDEPFVRTSTVSTGFDPNSESESDSTSGDDPQHHSDQGTKSKANLKPPPLEDDGKDSASDPDSDSLVPSCRFRGMSQSLPGRREPRLSCLFFLSVISPELESLIPRTSWRGWMARRGRRTAEVNELEEHGEEESKGERVRCDGSSSREDRVLHKRLDLGCSFPMWCLAR